jgi:hypothetical protein
MNGRALAVCTLAGTLVMFAWQAISNTVLPWHTATLPSFIPAQVNASMTAMMLRQLAIDLAGAWMLCLIAVRLRSREPLGIAAGGAYVALAVAVVKELADWNWYGFSFSYAVVNVIDLAIAFFLTGWVIGLLMKRFAPPVPATPLPA